MTPRPKMASIKCHDRAFVKSAGCPAYGVVLAVGNIGPPARSAFRHVRDGADASPLPQRGSPQRPAHMGQCQGVLKTCPVPAVVRHVWECGPSCAAMPRGLCRRQACTGRCGGLWACGGTSFDARSVPLPLRDFSRMHSGAPGKAAFGRALSVDTRGYSF